MLFQFQFVNSFLALFYTAFYLQDIDKLKEVTLEKLTKNFSENEEMKIGATWQLIFSASGSSADHQAGGGQPQGVPFAICNKTPQGDNLYIQDIFIELEN